jgi:ATP-binding cassette, subfamily B, bacterial PglK
MHDFKVLYQSLTPGERRSFFVLLILTIISGFVEMVGVGLTIPFMATAANGSPFGVANQLNTGLNSFLLSVGVPQNRLIVALGLLFGGGLLLANVMLCAYQWYAAAIVSQQRAHLAVRLLRKFSIKPLEFYDQNNSAELSKSIMTDVDWLGISLNSAVQLIALAARCAVIYLFFLYTHFNMALAMLVLLSCSYYLVFLCVHTPLSKAGVDAQSSNSAMYEISAEVLGGHREIRFSGTADYFLRRFEHAAERSISPQIVRTMPTHLTRAGLETVTVGTVIAVLIYFHLTDGGLNNGLPLLSAYAIAGIRLLPALQQGLSHWSLIRFFGPAAHRVVAALVEPDVLPTPAAPPAPVRLHKEVALCNVEFRYSTGPLILQGINLRIPKLKRVALVGSTGAGKSTLLEILLGMRSPSAGEVMVDDTVIVPELAAAWRANIGYVPQSIYLLDASIRQNVAFGVPPEQIDEDRLRVACLAASIHEYIQSLPDGYDTAVGERGARLSGGQCQRLGIARALYHEPELIVFDEATSSLDNVTESAILEAMENLRGVKTLVVVAHRLRTVWDFDTLFVLENGRVVGQGTAAELSVTCDAFKKLAMAQASSGDVAAERDPVLVR